MENTVGDNMGSYMKRYYAGRKESGLCAWGGCNNPRRTKLVKGQDRVMVHCLEHAERMRVKSLEKYGKRKALGGKNRFSV